MLSRCLTNIFILESQKQFVLILVFLQDTLHVKKKNLNSEDQILNHLKYLVVCLPPMLSWNSYVKIT